MTTGNDDDNNRDIVDLLEDVADVAKKVDDVLDGTGIKESVGGAKRHSIESPEPLRESHITEDSVKIVAEMNTDQIGEVGVNFRDGEVEIVTDGKNLIAEVPDDVVKDSLEATINNGVLIVDMERTVDTKVVESEEQPEDADISVDPVEYTDEPIDEGGDDDGDDE